METISLAEFRVRIKAQAVASRIHAAFKCPMCKTAQSITSFTSVGVEAGTAENYIGFSCVGRVTGAKGPRKKPDGKPCDWTLGGLFHFHELEVIDEKGKAHPHFEIATPEEAQSLQAILTTTEGAGA